MKKILVLMVAAGVLLFASSAFGQAYPVNMYFNGVVDGNSWDGGDTGFYGGTINGNPTNMLCDDFADHIGTGEHWTAVGFNVETLLNNWSTLGSQTLFGGSVGETGYLEMAILVEASFGGNIAALGSIGASVDDVSQVLWCITGGPTNCNSSGMSANAWALWQWVKANYSSYTASMFANLWVYTAKPPGPQEMWGQIPVPEGGAALMYLLLAGVSCFGAMFFRSRRMA